MKQINKNKFSLLNKKNNNNNINNNNASSKHIKTKVLTLCEYCYRPVKLKEIIKCSKCDLKLCKGCLTFIDHRPFCNNCIVEIVRNKSLLIITRGEIFNNEKKRK